MSLINDALKKAQTMQAPSAKSGLRLASQPPEIPAPPAVPASTPPSNVEPASTAPEPPHAKRSNPIPLLVLGAGTFLAAFCALGTIAFFLLREGHSELVASTRAGAPPKAAAQQKPNEPETPAPPTVQPVAPVTPADTPPPVSPAPIAPVPVRVAAPPEATEGTVDGSSKSVPLATPAVEPPAPAPPKPVVPSRPRDQRLLSYALSLHVSGIRGGSSPKALINDRVYSIGEFINVDYDLRLARIDLRRLELEDSFGNFYEVRF